MRLRSIALACLAGLALAAVLHSGALVFATLTASALAALVVTTRRRLFRAVTFDRTLSRRVVDWGGELEVTMSVTNAKLLPLVWMRVRDEWPGGLEPLGFALRPVTYLGRQVFAQTVSVRWYERLRRRYRVRCTERGLHSFGPVELEAGDPFGVAGVTKALAASRDVVVLPRVLRVPGFEQFIGDPLMEETVAHSLATDPTALRGIRAYRAGDPMRAINWRATARAGSLQTNEFDPTSLAAVRLLMDVQSRRRAWEGIDPELIELLCVVTASLAAAAAERGLAVGLASNAMLAHDWSPVDVVAEQGVLPQVLETLALLRPFSSRTFSSVLAGELAGESGRADCIVVTAALGKNGRALAARLRADRPTCVVHIGTPDANEAPFVDLVVPSDFDWRTSDALPLLA